MPTSRLEAFSDGVLAIIITVMVLSFQIPEGDSFRSLVDTTALPYLTYVLSFTYVGMYWNNHHHLLHAVPSLSGWSLWANHHWLFWLSLLPFATAWVDQEGFSRVPVMCYGIILLLCAFSFFLLQAILLLKEDPDSQLRRVLRVDRTGTNNKDKASLVLYLLGVLLAAFGGPLLPEEAATMAAMGCFVVVAVIWVVPDRQLEKAIEESNRAAAAS